jgi:4'-phosphopantetheinyl transferase
MSALRVVVAGPDAASRFDPARLSPRDAERWQRGFARADKRREFEVSRALLAAEGLSGFDFGPGRSASLSHSHGHAAVAVASPGRVVGVDLEWRRARDIAGLEAWCYSEAELAAATGLPDGRRAEQFHLRWAIKEAALKALGLRFPGGLRAVEISFAGDVPTAVALPAAAPFRVVVWRPRNDAVLALVADAGVGGDPPAEFLALRDLQQGAAHWMEVADVRT